MIGHVLAEKYRDLAQAGWNVDERDISRDVELLFGVCSRVSSENHEHSLHGERELITHTAHGRVWITALSYKLKETATVG